MNGVPCRHSSEQMDAVSPMDSPCKPHLHRAGLGMLCTYVSPWRCHVFMYAKFQLNVKRPVPHHKLTDMLATPSCTGINNHMPPDLLSSICAHSPPFTDTATSGCGSPSRAK